jgi:hypothetical protein
MFALPVSPALAVMILAREHQQTKSAEHPEREFLP